jgi:hypothetical protein
MKISQTKGRETFYRHLYGNFYSSRALKGRELWIGGRLLSELLVPCIDIEASEMCVGNELFHAT